MSTETTARKRILFSILVGLLFSFGAGAALGDIKSDQPGAILIFPKIVVDTSGVFGLPTDTELQITNTSNSPVSARCFLIDGTSRCRNNPSIACRQADEADGAARCPTGDVCDEPSWTKTDFRFTLTKRQPIAWQASEGLLNFPCDGRTQFCAFDQSNENTDGSPSSILPVPDDPFFGELRCVQVDPNDFQPSAGFNPDNGRAGDLKGEATIVSADGSVVDASKHNAIAIQSTTVNNRDDTLQIGGNNPEYNACPNVLTIDHIFDDATVEHGAGSSTVTTDLTFVPCSQDLNQSVPGSAVLQYLVFNEFEQRFSASDKFTCWKDVQLSDINSRPGMFGNQQSIFNVGVQGTIAGQTRVRSVEGSARGNGVLAVMEETWQDGCNGAGCRSAGNVHFNGAKSNPDYFILPPDLP